MRSNRWLRVIRSPVSAIHAELDSNNNNVYVRPPSSFAACRWLIDEWQQRNARRAATHNVFCVSTHNRYCFTHSYAPCVLGKHLIDRVCGSAATTIDISVWYCFMGWPYNLCLPNINLNGPMNCLLLLINPCNSRLDVLAHGLMILSNNKWCVMSADVEFNCYIQRENVNQF